MDLNTLWFILVGVLYTGFFVLEGFDFGVGMLLRSLGKDDLERRMIINTVGPHWDGNEVWLITAGGATFAAFPQWYATLFSGFYLPLFLLLMALILRGVAFEFRSKEDSPRWRGGWDWAILIGSGMPPLLVGVAFANLVRGVPIDGRMQYTGGFFNLLNPYALVAGLATVALFALHGAVFLALKTTGPLQERARAVALRLWLPTAIVALGLLAGTYLSTDALTHLGVNPGIIPVTGLAALAVCGLLLRKRREGLAFLLTSYSIVAASITLFALLFPRVMVSSLNPAWSLTIYTAASGPHTLRLMSIVAVVFVPVVLAYQAWSYWVFRKRIERKPESLTY
jgi:cytochrome bd ubiquinol oxidase subunit II